MGHQRHLDMLLKIAAATDKVGGARMAAAVVKKGRILGVGVNGQKSHPLQRFSKNGKVVGRHAEVDAIAQVGYNMPPGATLYVARIKWASERMTHEVAALAKPCCGCMKVAEMFGIDHIVWSTEDGWDSI